MKKLSIVFVIASSCFSQVNWTNEIVDSMPGTAYDYYFNSLAIDEYGIPHIVYNKDEFNKLIYASRVGSVWQKETVESGLFYYSFSLMFDDTNIPHLSYYKRDDALNKTYICYARHDGAGWLYEAVDSSTGSFGNYFWDFCSSIDIDTSNLPGIAYIAWHVEDSLHYIKYAHYNGIDWDTSIVARDTAWAHRYPLDWSPSLKFDRKGTPYIAFHRIRGQTDTVKIAYLDDTLNTWIVEPAVCYPYGGYPVSLALNSQDYPCIAHGLSVDVAYSWWDGSTWHTESTGTTMGWISVRIILDLDSLDNPHIAYLPDPMIAHVSYCYKRGNVWYLCGWIEPDPFSISEGDISFVLDNTDQPHVSFRFSEWDSVSQTNYMGIKYAKGTFVGIEETEDKMPEPRYELQVHPNPFRNTIDIKWQRKNAGCNAEDLSLKIYDVSGRVLRQFDYPGIRLSDCVTWDGKEKNGRELPNGVYLIRLETPAFEEAKKIILLK